jgi:hypothetical protein
MSKKIYAMLLPVVAVAAFAIAPATSQAAVHWSKCEKVAAGTFLDVGCTEAGGSKTFAWKVLPFTEAKTQIVTWGTLTLTDSEALKVECKVIDAGNVWNGLEAAQGKDNIEVFVNYECKSASCATVTIAAKKLPYSTELAAGPIDKIKGIEITVNCSGTEVTFTGELSPKVVNGTTQVAPTVAKFEGAGSETLTGPGTVTATVTGSDRITGFLNGEGIKAE